MAKFCVLRNKGDKPAHSYVFVVFYIYLHNNFFIY